MPPSCAQVNFCGDHTKLILSGWEPLLVTLLARNRSTCTYLASTFSSWAAPRSAANASLCSAPAPGPLPRLGHSLRAATTQALRPEVWACQALALTFVALPVPLVPHWGLWAESPRESGTSFTGVGQPPTPSQKSLSCSPR